MAMNGYVDEMMCEGLFDNIEDLLDFSSDDEVLGMGDDSSAPSAGGGGDGGGDGDGATQMPPASVSAEAASSPSSDGEGCRVSAPSDETKFCDEINIHEDWITNFLDDSNFDIDFPVATGIISPAAPPSNDYVSGSGKGDDSLFQSFSPVSVLDELNHLSSSNDKGGSSSSSSSSSSRTNGTTANTISLAMAPVGPTMMLVPARARSKRPRRAAPAPAHVAVPIVPPASEGPPAVPTLLPECESFGESEPCTLLTMKKKKKKNYQDFLAGNARGDDTTAVRKCQHCGLQKTPQWRAGPMGPKTLCNACGVRYKSGRLFPEYRPAASPTFVPSIHSNSHKKVVEMRIKACQLKAANGMPSPEYPAAKNCDLLAYIRRRE